MIQEWTKEESKGFRRLGDSPKRHLQSLPSVLDGTIFIVLILLLTLIYSPAVLRHSYLPEIGEIANHNVRADQDLLIEDKETTRNRRQEAALAVAPVYDWDPNMPEPIILLFEDALSWLESIRTNISETSKSTFLDSFIQKMEEQEVTPEIFDLLLAEPDLMAVARQIRAWVSQYNGQRVVGGPENLKDMQKKVYTIHSIVDNFEEKLSGSENLIDLSGMRRLLAESAIERLAPISKKLRTWIVTQVQSQIRPNLVLNLAETQMRRQKAFDAVEPVFFQAKRGQIIVREGAEITEAVRLKIDALALTLTLFLLLGHFFMRLTHPYLPGERKKIYVLGAILLVTALIASITFAIGQGLSNLLQWPEKWGSYLPHPSMGAALAILTMSELPGCALILGTILSILVALLADGGLPFFIYHMIGSLTGAITLRSSRRRFDVLRAGVWIGFMQMLAVPVVESLDGSAPSWDWLMGALMAFTSGLLAALWGLALIPLLESLFNVMTDSRLLELASGDHPLLKQLSLRAPGTYHHSVMMGNLTEAAAEVIGANPLLARVMAMYHDIGKLSKPHYFIENQSGINRHDLLSPTMSTKVIMAHVKDGEEMALRYKLGEPIREAIITHHGNSLLQFFYNKALRQGEQRGETVEEIPFRYGGPKPNMPESGILMLADSVEAAARTLKSPNPAQIQAMVRRIVASKIADGQLDDCHLTLRQISRIEEAFSRVLTLGFYHHRILYPDQDKQTKEGNRNAGNHPDKSRSS
ncbi:MAG: HDIG domain-containing protein [Magnetococcus sp. DMHC-6]